MSQFAVHHSPELFGPDELDFRPERWLHESQGGDESSWDKIKEMERNNDLIFGHGKYGCLGKSIAQLELNKVFVELLRRCEFSMVNPEKPWDSNKCYGIHLQRGLWVTVSMRA
jgi:cytochrome P450